MQAVRDAYGVVGKAMHRLDAQLVRTDVAEHHSAACRAKINRSHPSLVIVIARMRRRRRHRQGCAARWCG